MANSVLYDGRNEPVNVVSTGSELTVTLKDGRRIVVPLWWYPSLRQATPAQRARFALMPLGIHWPDLDEDISVRSLLLGNKAPGAVPPARTPEPVGQVRAAAACRGRIQAFSGISRSAGTSRASLSARCASASPAVLPFSISLNRPSLIPAFSASPATVKPR